MLLIETYRLLIGFYRYKSTVKFHFSIFFANFFPVNTPPSVCFAFFCSTITNPALRLHSLPLTFFVLPMHYCQNCTSNSLCFAFFAEQARNADLQYIFQEFATFYPSSYDPPCNSIILWNLPYLKINQQPIIFLSYLQSPI